MPQNEKGIGPRKPDAISRRSRRDSSSSAAASSGGYGIGHQMTQAAASAMSSIGIKLPGLSEIGNDGASSHPRQKKVNSLSQTAAGRAGGIRVDAAAYLRISNTRSVFI